MKIPKVIVRRIRKPRNKPKLFGQYQPSNNTIIIDPDKNHSEREYLDTVVHEALHAAYPVLSEEAVHEGSDVLANVLWDHGYRKV